MTDLDERIARLSPSKRALLESMLQRGQSTHGTTAAVSAGIPTVQRVDPLPLSFAQERMWIQQQLDPESAAFNLVFSLRADGEFDQDALRRALGFLLERHESLRTCFKSSDDGKPQQSVVPNVTVSMLSEDLSSLDQQERKQASQRHQREEMEQPFDLSQDVLLRCRLLRFSLSEHLIIIAVHHIAFDAWSMSALFRDLGTAYKAFVAGETPQLPALSIQYADYASWQRRQFTDELFEKHLDYWRNRLSGLATLELPTDRPRPAIAGHAGAAIMHDLRKPLSDGLRTLARQHGTTLFMTLLAGFVVCLNRYSGQDDVVVGTAIANRTEKELEPLVGLFVNTLVLRNDLSGKPTFAELLSRVRETALGAYAHQAMPFEKLVEALEQRRDLSRNPLFQVAFALREGRKASMSLPALESGQLSITPVTDEVRSVQFDLDCHVIEGVDTLVVQLNYNTDLFDASTIERLLAHYERVLESVVADPGIQVSNIELLSADERRRLLKQSTGRVSEDADGTTLLSRIDKIARNAPQSPALGFGDHSLTYGDLEQASNRLAHRLRKLGAGVDLPVGVLLDRSPEMIVAWLAVLKSGAAYLPLDPEYPTARLQYMLEDSAAVVLISNRTLAQRVPEFTGHCIRIDEDAAQIDNEEETPPTPKPTPENLAYLIYTSGSTGQPKGVAVEHRALDNLVAWHNREYALSASDRATQIAGLGFDACVWEVWPYLAAGASVHLVDENARLSPVELWQWLARKRITIAFVPTPMAEAMLCEPIPETIELKAMLTGGDRLHGGGLPQQLPFRLINHYGPTENAVVSTYGEVDLATAGQTEPVIGRPIDNVQAYVLDTQMQPVPIGVIGELYLGGNSLARGYWRREDLTDEKFVSNPFDADAQSRLYRSGDLVRWRKDGTLDFIGRVDQQVKIRGYRIELGEIESTLNAHPGIAQGAVICQSEDASSKQLWAYIVKSSSEQNLSVIRDDLRERLPSYMLPSFWVELDTLPLTPNGKVDRDALPEPQDKTDIQQAYTAPRNELEQRIAAIWCEVLGVDKVGVNDNFFDLGGHSLVASQVISRIRDEFKINLMLSSFFMRPTVAGLAEQIQISVLVGTDEDGGEDEAHEEFRL